MKTILKLTRNLLLLVLITSAISASAKNKAAANNSTIKVQELVSPYFPVPRYVSGDYWGIELSIRWLGGTSYEGNAACGILNNHILTVPIVTLPSALTVNVYLTSTSYTGPLTMTIPAGSNSSGWIPFGSAATLLPTVSYTSSSPSTLGTPPDNPPVQLESISYVNYTP